MELPYIRGDALSAAPKECTTHGEIAAGPVEFRIYGGADGEFDLYHDAGQTYDYENGAHSIIPLQWSVNANSDRRESTGAVSRDACKHADQNRVGIRRGTRTSSQPRLNRRIRGKAISVQAP
jgi:alpha-glucosidase (family GH31 glycosyl hydrolase)